jgi:hypothetical protein
VQEKIIEMEGIVIRMVNIAAIGMGGMLEKIGTKTVAIII